MQKDLEKFKSRENPNVPPVKDELLIEKQRLTE